MSVKTLLRSLHAPAEATAKASHGKAKVVESEDFSPLSSAIGKTVKAVEAKDDEKKSKAKSKAKSKSKAKAKDDEETEAA